MYSDNITNLKNSSVIEDGFANILTGQNIITNLNNGLLYGCLQKNNVAKQRTKRDLKKISLFNFFKEETMNMIKNDIDKKLEGTGITIDELFNQQTDWFIDKFSKYGIEVLSFIHISYDEVFYGVINKINHHDKIFDLHFQGMLQKGETINDTAFRLFSEYFDAIKKYCKEAISHFDLVNTTNIHNRDFPIIFLPWLKEISFLNDGKIAERNTYNKVFKKYNSWKNIFSLYLNQAEQKLIKLKFDIACLINDWEKVSICLNVLDISVQERLLTTIKWNLVFQYNINVKKRSEFINQVWDKAGKLGIQRQMLQDRNYLVFTFAAKNDCSAVVDSLWDKAGKLDGQDLQLQMLQDSNYLAFTFAIENGHDAVVDSLWDKAGKLGVQLQMLQINNYWTFLFAATNGYDTTVDSLWDKAGALDVQRKMLEANHYEAFRFAADNGHIKVVDSLWDKAEKLGVQHQMLQIKNYQAFIFAAGDGHYTIVDSLWDKAGKLGVQRQMLQIENYQAFKFAAGNGYDITVSSLWNKAEELGVQRKMLESDSYQTFIWAATSGHIKIVNSLWDKAGELDVAVQYQMLQANDSIVLIWSAQEGNDEIVSFLCEKVVELDIQEDYLKIVESLSNEKILNKIKDLIIRAKLTLQEARVSGNICLLSHANKIRKKRAIVDNGCLVKKDEAGIEVNEKRFDESKINNEKLKAYQEEIKDKGDEINNQFNELITEIQQAKALRNFYDLNRKAKEKLSFVLANRAMISSKSTNYFVQICKLNLLRIISPAIKDRNFYHLLFYNPEKLIQNHHLLENIFISIETFVSEKYKQQQLKYEDFKKLENRINQEISEKSGKLSNVAEQDINKSNLSNYVFQSIGLSLILMDQSVSTDLQKRIYYETLISIGVLIHDHKSHIKAYHNEHRNHYRIDSLKKRIQSSKLLSVAHDLYYLYQNLDNVDQYSNQVKNKIELYGNINSEYKLNEIYNQFHIDEVKSYFSEDELKKFSVEFEAYDKEVITIHYTQISRSYGKITIVAYYDRYKTKDLTIGKSVEIRNTDNYILDKQNLQIKLKTGSKEYIITPDLKEGRVMYYLNIEGYKVKVSSIVQDRAIRDKLHQLKDKIELLENKRDIEDIADTEISDQDYEDVINKIKQGLLTKGVSKNTFKRFEEQLDSTSKEVFKEYINEIEKSLAKNDIIFDRRKFDTAKTNGYKSIKFFFTMAIYDLIDSIKDALEFEDNNFLKQVSHINGILDAMSDVRESLSVTNEGKSGPISRNSKLAKITHKMPKSMRKVFVKTISNPIVQTITFATIAYQFGYSINEIAKGDHNPLNYYWTVSSGIKLVSMSIKPISMGVAALTRSMGISTKTALRVLSIASKVLGKVSMVFMVADTGLTIIIEGYEAGEYVKTIATNIPLSNYEQYRLFLDHAPTIKGLLYGFSLTITLTDLLIKTKTPEEYEDDIKIKGYLEPIKITAKKILEENPNIAAIVQYVTSIEEKYDEIIKSRAIKYLSMPQLHPVFREMCVLENKYTGVSPGKINSKITNLYSLDISKVLPLIPDALYGKKIYLVNQNAKHLPHITSDEYNSGLRVISMPLSLHKNNPTCGGIINEKVKLGYKTRCNIKQIYRNCIKAFVLSDNPFIFTKESKKAFKGPILYLSGPERLTVAENYPAVIYVSGNNVDYTGSKNYETIFIISNRLGMSHLTGGFAIAEKNFVIMNVTAHHSNIDLNKGYIEIKESETVISSIIKLDNVYNYISYSITPQNIITGCKTRYINAGSSKIGNVISQSPIDCQSEDHEERVINKNDRHYTGLKQTIFIVCKDSDNATISHNHDIMHKNNTDIIRLQDIGIKQLRINEVEDYYSLELLTKDKQTVTSSIKIDNFKNLVIQTAEPGVTKVISVQNKSLSDVIEDMWYQEMNKSEENHINDQIMQDSERKSKVVVLAIIMDKIKSACEVARNIADNNLGIPISRIEVTQNYAGAPKTRAIVGGMYSDLIIVNLSYNRTNPIKDTIHLTGNGGKNTYVINMPIIKSESRQFLLPSESHQEFEVSIYNVNQGNTIDSIDLRNVVKRLNDKQLLVSQSGSDLLIKLIVEVNENTFGRTLIVRIKNGVRLRERFHVYLGPTPMKFKLSNGRWKLEPIPFSLERIGVMPVNYQPNREQRHNSNHRHNRYYVDQLAILTSSATRQTSLICKGTAWIKRLVSKLFAQGTSDIPHITPKSVCKQNSVYHSKDTNIHWNNGQLLLINQKQGFDNSQAFKQEHKILSSFSRVTNSASSLSSWINDLFGWVKISIDGLFNSRAALPEKTLNNTTQSSLSQVNAPTDVNGIIILLDLFIRKVTGQKHIFSVDQDISLLEAQGYALNITKGFEKAVEQAALKSNISMHRLNIGFVGVQEEVTKKIIGGKFDEISEILKSHIETACPSREAGCPGKLSSKKFDKFMPAFNNISLDQSIQQILYNSKNVLGCERYTRAKSL